MAVIALGLGAVLIGLWLAEGLIIWAAVFPLALAGLPAAPSPPRPARPACPASRHPLPPAGWTRRQAMHPSMFWVIAGEVAVVALLGTGLTFDQISLLGERGLPPAEAAANFIPQMAAGLAAGRSLVRLTAPRALGGEAAS
jgi:hypothetical protein